MALFFDAAYAGVIFLAFALVGFIPGSTLGLLAPRGDRRLLLPAVGLALAGWIWAGWLGGLYGISRPGLVLFTSTGASGFVCGWSAGLRAGSRIRTRHESPEGDRPAYRR